MLLERSLSALAIWHRLMRGRSLPAPPWLPIIAEGKQSYDLEYQLPAEAP
jgi:hypothetical protein